MTKQDLIEKWNREKIKLNEIANSKSNLLNEYDKGWAEDKLLWVEQFLTDLKNMEG